MQKCKNTRIKDPTLPSLPTTPITRIKARALISPSFSLFNFSCSSESPGGRHVRLHARQET